MPKCSTVMPHTSVKALPPHSRYVFGSVSLFIALRRICIYTTVSRLAPYKFVGGLETLPAEALNAKGGFLLKRGVNT